MELLTNIHAMSCLDFNAYTVGVAAAAIVGNIFWFFMYCVAKGAHNEDLTKFGVEIE